MRRRDAIAGVGAATVWSLTARARPRPPRTVGCLDAASESAVRPLTAAFRSGLAEQGYAEGRNIEVLYRFAEAQYARLPVLAADLARHGVAVIAAITPVAALAAKSAAGTIPVVFEAGDPVELGLTTSLNHPGGNVTGASILADTLLAKRLELLHELVPTRRSIGLLINPTNILAEAHVKEVERAARTVGVPLVTLNAGTQGEIELVFAVLAGRRVGAILVDAELAVFYQYDSTLRIGGALCGAGKLL